MSSAIPLPATGAEAPALSSPAHAIKVDKSGERSEYESRADDSPALARTTTPEEATAVAYAQYVLEHQMLGQKPAVPLEAEAVLAEKTHFHRDSPAELLEATKDDQPYEGLSRNRDDYYPSSLARDPKVERPVGETVYMDGDKKRRFKKPREVSLVADFIRRFLKTKHYDLDRSLKDQSEAVNILLRKLQIVFPHGDWTPFIVKSLIREKTKKKRSSVAAATAMTMTMMQNQDCSSGEATPQRKRPRHSSGDHDEFVVQHQRGGVADADGRLRADVIPEWAAELMAKVEQNSAAMANLRIRRHNASRIVSGKPLRPLLKEREGLMDCTALTPELVTPPVTALGETMPRVGDTPAMMQHQGMFPGSMAEATQMSHDQVLQLLHFYNDDMGIVAGDDLESRIQKLLFWIRE